MDISFCGGMIHGNVTAPPSKSCTHRALLLASLSDGRCKIENPLSCYDTNVTIDALKSLGVTISYDGDRIIVDSKEFHAPDGAIDAGNSGTTLRFMTGLSALFPWETVLTGDESLRGRPMQPIMDALESCDVQCHSNDGHAPISVKGPIHTDSITVDGSMSSQFISSLLMISPMVGNRIDFNIGGKTVSKPYIDMTLEMMKLFGAYVIPNRSGYTVEPMRYKPTDIRIPGDWSSAAFLLVAGALGGDVTVDGLDARIPQADMTIIDILKDAGFSIEENGHSFRCRSSGRPRHMDVDLSDCPDLFPIVSVLLSVADGKSTIYGANHLRYKESDRITTTVSMLKDLGAYIEATDDGCIINGRPILRGGRVEHNGDHRIMMSAAIASLVSEESVSMADDGCWNVSFPGFPEMIKDLGMRC